MGLPAQKLEILERELQKMRVSAARRSLIDFVRYTFPGFIDGWFPQDLCNRLQLFFEKTIAGERPSLIIQTPPRHGKTELVSIRFVCWVLGKDPNTSLISCGYGADLPERNSRFCHDVINSDLYKDVFPGIQLGTSRADTWDIEGYSGVVRAAGIGGGIAGYGARILIVDDWCKDHQEAESPTIQQRNIDWFIRVANPRLSPDGARLIIGTRWHLNDLVGMILEREADKWEVISYPALAEQSDEHRQEGEALHPERYSTVVLKEIMKTMGAASLPLYQQRPQPTEGVSVFTDDSLQRQWRRAIDPQRGEISQIPGDGAYQFVPMAGGMLRLWEEPIRGFSYCAGWDVATGEDVYEGERDYHAVRIVRKGIRDDIVKEFMINPDAAVKIGDPHKPCLVATWHGRTDLWQYANTISILLTYFNMAYGLGERNGTGEGVLDFLKELYPRNLILRAEMTGLPQDKVGTKMGFYTTQHNKPGLIADTVKAYNDDLIYDPDRESLDEMAHFINRSGKLCAASRFHDDRVMATALAWKAHTMADLMRPRNLVNLLADRKPPPRPIVRDLITGY